MVMYIYIYKPIVKGQAEHNCKPFGRYVKARKQENVGVSPLKRENSIFKK